MCWFLWDNPSYGLVTRICRKITELWVMRPVCLPPGIWSRWLLFQLPGLLSRRPVWDLFGGFSYGLPCSTDLQGNRCQYLFCIWDNPCASIFSSTMCFLAWECLSLIDKLCFISDDRYIKNTSICSSFSPQSRTSSKTGTLLWNLCNAQGCSVCSQSVLWLRQPFLKSCEYHP